MTTKSILAAAILIPLFLSGCATGPGQKATAARDALLKADRDFAALAHRTSVAEAFVFYAAPEALLLPMGGRPVQSRDKIREFMSQGPDELLLWEPKDAAVADSGELGYTWGTYEVHERNKPNSAPEQVGKYLTLWRRQADGSWKYILDIGNKSPPP